MAIPFLTYEPPVRHSRPWQALDYDLLEAANELAQEGENLRAVQKVLEHLLPGIESSKLVAGPVMFVQGSSKVFVQVEGAELVVRVPLVKLPTDGRAVGALRYVLTRIAGSGQLYQPRLVGDEIYLEYRDGLERQHPAKVLEVLQKIAREADESDDLLITQFGALPLDRAPITPLDESELSRCVSIWNSHIALLEDLFKECQRKRSYFFLNELTAYTIYRIRLTLPVSGHLANRINEAACSFNDADEDPNKREASLARFIKEMKAVSPVELAKNLGHATYALNPLSEGTSRALRGYLSGGYMDTIKELRESGKVFDAAFGLFGTYTYLLANFSWPEPIESKLKEGLTKVSGKPWKETANVLCQYAEDIISEFTDDEDDEDSEEEDDDDENEGGAQ